MVKGCFQPAGTHNARYALLRAGKLRRVVLRRIAELKLEDRGKDGVLREIAQILVNIVPALAAFVLVCLQAAARYVPLKVAQDDVLGRKLQDAGLTISKRARKVK